MIETDQVESCLKSIYGEKWRQGLLAHLLIGSGRFIGGTEVDQQRERKPEAIGKLERNPLGFLRSRDERLADTLWIRACVIRFKTDWADVPQNSPNIGDLIETIGVWIVQRLEGTDNSVVSSTLETLSQGIVEVVDLCVGGRVGLPPQAARKYSQPDLLAVRQDNIRIRWLREEAVRLCHGSIQEAPDRRDRMVHLDPRIH